MKEFIIELAASGQSSCNKCHKQIPKGEFRVKIKQSAYPYNKQYSECLPCGKESIECEIGILKQRLDRANEIIGKV